MSLSPNQKLMRLVEADEHFQARVKALDVHKGYPVYNALLEGWVDILKEATNFYTPKKYIDPKMPAGEDATDPVKMVKYAVERYEQEEQEKKNKIEQHEQRIKDLEKEFSKHGKRRTKLHLEYGTSESGFYKDDVWAAMRAKEPSLNLVPSSPLDLVHSTCDKNNKATSHHSKLRELYYRNSPERIGLEAARQEMNKELLNTSAGNVSPEEAVRQAKEKNRLENAETMLKASAATDASTDLKYIQSILARAAIGKQWEQQYLDIIDSSYVLWRRVEKPIARKQVVKGEEATNDKEVVATSPTSEREIARAMSKVLAGAHRKNDATKAEGISELRASYQTLFGATQSAKEIEDAVKDDVRIIGDIAASLPARDKSGKSTKSAER